MKSGNRLVLTMWLALIASVCITAPSSAQESDVAARSAQIAELSRAGKYSEAIPLAQRQLADLEKAYGPVHRDVAAALNNLALLYGDQGRDAEAEPLYKRSLAIMEKAFGLDSAGGRTAPEQSGGALPAAGALCRCRAAVQTGAGDPREVARARPSRRRAVAEQSGHPLREAGPPCRLRAAVQAGACDLREGGRPGASAVATAAEQSRPGRQGPGPLCRGRAADQAVAGDPRKSARARSSRCREIAEQSGGPL